MRRSRLYLTLSIVSLMVAFGLGVAQKNCRYFKRSVPCSIQQHEPGGEAGDCSSRPEVAVWGAFYGRDFDRMAAEATLLRDRDDPTQGTRLRAYALRGQGRYEAAIKAYDECMLTPAGRAGRPVICDAYIGRAHCFHMLGNETRANEDIQAALLLARPSGRDELNEAAHYQFACAFAVHADMLTGKQAAAARRNAIREFQRAIELGFDKWEHARADLDLDALRDESAFLSLFP